MEKLTVYGRFKPQYLPVLVNFDIAVRSLRGYLPTVTPGCPFRYPAKCDRQATFSSSGTITITSLLSQAPPQIVDTCMSVKRLALTGNVLLALGSRVITTWRLTEEGVAFGIFVERTGRDDRIWAVATPENRPMGDLKLSVEGRAGIVECCGRTLCHIYDTRTEDVCKLVRAPLPSDSYFYSPISEALNYSTSHHKLLNGALLSPSLPRVR